MAEWIKTSRRELLKSASNMVPGLMMAGSAGAILAQCKGRDGEEEVSPAEDLMREHGVLKRVMLIYEEVLQRIARRQGFPSQALADSAQIIRTFIEDYHEILEEDFLFPRFRKAKRLLELVAILSEQHKAGRTLTDIIIQNANDKALRNTAKRKGLASSMRLFNRMYAPHEAREDTILFPALHSIMTKNEYDSLGDEFEKKEHQLFGKEGFEGMVDKVASIEKQLGIYDLARFTPVADS